MALCVVLTFLTRGQAGIR